MAAAGGVPQPWIAESLARIDREGLESARKIQAASNSIKVGPQVGLNALVAGGVFAFAYTVWAWNRAVPVIGLAFSSVVELFH